MITLDQKTIGELIDPQEMMDQIEEAYRIFGEGDFYMPPRPVFEHENKTMIYMPCYTKDVIGTKILSSFPENRELGLPTLDGVVLLNDAKTGTPTAILDGQAVTAWRTGAVGGVGMRHLAKKDAKSVGIVGAGTQGFYQAVYACAARPIEQVYLYSHSGRDLTDYIERLKDALNNSSIEVSVCDDVKDLVQKSDIICTTTPSEVPLLPDDTELLRGKCIIGIGSYTPKMREIPNAIWDLVDKVYIELPYACEESGDLGQPLEEGRITQENVVLMSDLLSGKAEVTTRETTYFKSVGMALFDVCAAQYLLKKAKEQTL